MSIYQTKSVVISNKDQSLQSWKLTFTVVSIRTQDLDCMSKKCSIPTDTYIYEADDWAKDCSILIIAQLDVIRYIIITHTE